MGDADSTHLGARFLHDRFMHIGVKGDTDGGDYVNTDAAEEVNKLTIEALREIMILYQCSCQIRE